MSADTTRAEIALQILAFARTTHLNTERGWAFLDGVCAGLNACGRGDLAAPLGDWPCQTADQLAWTINHWLRQPGMVSPSELASGTPFEG